MSLVLDYLYTVFPRNLAAARFYFKAPLGVTTIRGQRLQRSTRTRVPSFNNKPSCIHVKCLCAYGNCCRPLTMRRDFEGSIYWDELADRCGEISRAAGFRDAARFRGNTVASLTHCDHVLYYTCLNLLKNNIKQTSAEHTILSSTNLLYTSPIHLSTD